MRRRRSLTPAVVILPALMVAVWWLYPRAELPTPSRSVQEQSTMPLLTTNRPESAPVTPPRPGVTEKGDHQKASTKNADDEPLTVARARTLIDAGKQALVNNDPVAARTYFSEALTADLPEAEVKLLRAELSRIGQLTIFSLRIFPNDPFVFRYIIKTGDTLGKIAKANKVSPELIASINNISDPNRIREGQSIKVIKGPFLADVDTTSYTLGIYLGSTYVKQFPVGLGQDSSTPRGQWRVTTKLINPTYYPPRGGQIIAADDPDNPLGERWIGLQGISGEALGQLRYGIHGTNEPESIGHSISLGCIRMHNEDVEAIFTYLIEKYSTVTVHD